MIVKMYTSTYCSLYIPHAHDTSSLYSVCVYAALLHIVLIDRVTF